LAAVSRAPLAKIEPFRQRMGWTFPWYSSHGSDFNYDFHVTVDETVAPVLLNYRDEAELAQAGMPWSAERRGDHPGLSVFLHDGDTVFPTYSTYARGLEQPGGTYYYLVPAEHWAGRRTGRSQPAARPDRSTGPLPRPVRRLTPKRRPHRPRLDRTVAVPPRVVPWSPRRWAAGAATAAGASVPRCG